MDLNKLLVGGAASRPDSISGLQPQFASSLAAMFTGAPPDIQNQLHITSAFRSPTTQAGILANSLAKRAGPQAVAQWNDYVQRNGGDVVAAGQQARPWLRSLGITKWVAPPGGSNHQKGEAVDLTYLTPAATQWAHDNAPKYGLNFPLSNEDWHIEPAGIRGGGGGQAAPTAMASATPTANVQAPQSAPVTAGDPSTPPPASFAASGVAPPAAISAFAPTDQVATADPSATFGNLAALFTQDQEARNLKRQQDAQTEQARRLALFGATTPFG